MNKIYSIIAGLLITASVFAQAPEKMSYQAVIRNSSSALVTSTTVGMKISILQGISTGTPVYVETQTPTTNTNGLVSLEIGSGTVITGTFATIDWANGPYFIKTETDPTGGTNFTIEGTSQLLSVPYALHSKTAESVTGIDGSETKITAGTNVTVTGTGTTASPYVVNSTTGGSALAIGDSYQGGKIFWLDASGKHGLIAATADQSTAIQWHNGTDRYTGASGDGLYAGSMNTTMIVATQMADNQTGNFAAKVCADYSVTDGGVTYSDWYLPSKYELNLLYDQKTVVGGFVGGFYWSSTENDNSNAWNQGFGTGTTVSDVKNYSGYVRAVRAF